MRPTRRGYLLDVYIGKEYLLSYAVAFSFFFFIFLINNILLLAEDILSKSVPLFDVFRLLIFALPNVVALSAPFSSLLGGLMAIGYFVSNREVLAMQASGLPLRRVYLPVAFLGALFSIFSFYVNDYLLPIGTLQFNRQYQRLLFSNPELVLDSYSVQEYQDNIIITGAVSQGTIEGLVIIEPNPKEIDRRIILAERATLEMEDEGALRGILSLSLENVFSHGIDTERSDRYEYLSAKNMIYNILLRDVSASVRSPGPREKSTSKILEEIRIMQAAQREQHRQRLQEIARRQIELYNRYVAAPGAIIGQRRPISEIYSELKRLYPTILERDERPYDRKLRLYRIEYNKKFSLPLGCFFFTIFAFPVGLMARRSGRAVGFGVGVFVSVIYWTLYFGGQLVGIRSPSLSPIVAMWVPNIFIAVVGLVLLMIMLWLRK